MTRCTSYSIILQDSLINITTGKNQSISLIFGLGDNYQEKVASKTTTFDWVWPVVPLVQSDSMILWSSISLEGINWYLCQNIIILAYSDHFSHYFFFIYFLASLIKLSEGPFSYALCEIWSFWMRAVFINIFWWQKRRWGQYFSWKTYFWFQKSSFSYNVGKHYFHCLYSYSDYWYDHANKFCCQQTLTCSKSTIGTPEKCVEYVQS